MLHDLYLLSCYFDPASAMLYEEDLEKRYGVEKIREAIGQGWLQIYSMPSLRGEGNVICRLTPKGIDLARASLL